MSWGDRISVVGLGKLGAPMAACLASKGCQVVGIDLDPEKVAKLDKLESPVYEPGLDDLLRTVEGRLAVSTGFEAIESTDVTFVVVATPSDEDGGFSLRFALPACEAIGRAIAAKDEYHLVVMTSTVMPGATGGELLPALERASGKRCGEGFGLCYSPEFIALGSVISDFLNPDFLLIGESDPIAGERLAALYRRVCGDVPGARVNFVNAEIAKLSVNTFITTKITYANTLARICERIPGADVDAVTDAIGLDSRIGRKYLKGAISYGGPCFPRDNLALAALGRRVGAPALLAETTDRANRLQIRSLADLAISKLPGSGGRVGVLGLSYKPNTDVVEESPGLLLVQTLEEDGIPVSAYDPAAGVRNGEAQILDSAEACIAAADVLVITTPWRAFRELDPSLFERAGQRMTVIDCWRVLDRPSVEHFADYIALGQAGPGLRRDDDRLPAVTFPG